MSAEIDITSEQAAHAAALHREAIVIDGHCDVLMVVADEKMRLGQRVELPPHEGWEPPLGFPLGSAAALYDFTPHIAYFQTMGSYDIPRFLEGGLTSQAMAIYLQDHELDRALHRGMEMVAWLYREAEENSAFSVVTTVDQIRRGKAAGSTSGFLSFEGLEPLGSDLKMLDIFARLGLRMASLTHSRRNAFADGGGQPGDPITGGLTELGRQAIRRMHALGVVPDLGHLNLRGCWEVLALAEGPVVLSHARASRFAIPNGPGEADLQPWAALPEAIAASGGLIGVIAYNQPDLAAVVDDIAWLVERVGPDHVGLGTDFFGLDRAPATLQGMHHLPNLTAALVARGLDDPTILKILGANYLRIFDTAWH
jgi:membrane dipeptidase